MRLKKLPTQAEIKQALHYDPETGVFRWRNERAGGRIKPWTVAGSMDNFGYLLIGLNNTQYRQHRLAWVYMTGIDPTDEIDHIDMVKSNNAWSNLRQATRKQNNENIPLKKNNTSGIRNVHWHKVRKKWGAQVQHNGKIIYIGLFDTAEEAGKAAADKRAELFTHASRM